MLSAGSAADSDDTLAMARGRQTGTEGASDGPLAGRASSSARRSVDQSGGGNLQQELDQLAAAALLCLPAEPDVVTDTIQIKKREAALAEGLAWDREMQQVRRASPPQPYTSCRPTLYTGARARLVITTFAPAPGAQVRKKRKTEKDLRAFMKSFLTTVGLDIKGFAERWGGVTDNGLQAWMDGARNDGLALRIAGLQNETAKNLTAANEPPAAAVPAAAALAAPASTAAAPVSPPAPITAAPARATSTALSTKAAPPSTTESTAAPTAKPAPAATPALAPSSAPASAPSRAPASSASSSTLAWKIPDPWKSPDPLPPPPPPATSAPEASPSPSGRNSRNGAYTCSKCGLPKKGHICAGLMSPGDPSPSRAERPAAQDGAVEAASPPTMPVAAVESFLSGVGAVQEAKQRAAASSSSSTSTVSLPQVLPTAVCLIRTRNCTISLTCDR